MIFLVGASALGPLDMPPPPPLSVVLQSCRLRRPVVLVVASSASCTWHSSLLPAAAERELLLLLPRRERASKTFDDIYTHRRARGCYAVSLFSLSRGLAAQPLHLPHYKSDSARERRPSVCICVCVVALAFRVSLEFARDYGVWVGIIMNL